MHRPYLSRSEAAKYASDQGLPVAKNTLQKYATVGGGPDYFRFGNRAIYTPAGMDAWIEKKLSAPICSTSEIQSQVPDAKAFIHSETDGVEDIAT